MKLNYYYLRILLYFSSSIHQSNSEGHYDITMRSINCLDVDTNHILNLTCSIKAVRGKKGVMNLYWIYKDVQDAFVSSLLIQMRIINTRNLSHFTVVFIELWGVVEGPFD